MRRSPAVLIVAAAFIAAPSAWCHDIPNQRVDRSIQIELAPGKLRIDYEVSLTELTLVQDLRALLGELPKVESDELLGLYAQVTGSLNAKGLLVTLNDQPVALALLHFKVAVDEHPRFTFCFDLPLPERGEVAIRDTNFATSEGTSRLAMRLEGMVIESDRPLPSDVNAVRSRPIWQLTDDEERRSKEVRFSFRLASTAPNLDSAGARKYAEGGPVESSRSTTIGQPVKRAESVLPRLSGLLEASRSVPWVVLGALAVVLGAVHALEPGHGKTLVAAVALGPDVRLYQPAILGVATTIAHTGSVLAIGALLWWSGTSEVVPLHLVLLRGAGFAIAAAGFWRLGRLLGGHSVHDVTAGGSIKTSYLGLIGLGLVGGLVPCWDAVALIVLSTALGRLAAGVALVLAFSLGMGCVLVTVGALACQAKSMTIGPGSSTGWQTKLSLASAAVVGAIGVFLFMQ
jgi:nickel/cobalt exporter